MLNILVNTVNCKPLLKEVWSFAEIFLNSLRSFVSHEKENTKTGGFSSVFFAFFSLKLLEYIEDRKSLNEIIFCQCFIRNYMVNLSEVIESSKKNERLSYFFLIKLIRCPVVLYSLLITFFALHFLSSVSKEL